MPTSFRALKFGHCAHGEDESAKLEILTTSPRTLPPLPVDGDNDALSG